ncbi:hypothetical protein WJX73_007186 [Symbiochloris irregularis]|uniref:Chromo domain-containing protein n=1 Tax=Symbiochloris irregularis TaxID=706552 RepID=A0AAW1PCV3_9CHLO
MKLEVNPPPILVDGCEEFEVDYIVDHRSQVLDGHVEVTYLVKWVGYDDEDNTWEPATHLANAAESVQLYESNMAALEEAEDRYLNPDQYYC